MKKIIHKLGPEKWHACGNGKCPCKMIMSDNGMVCTVEAGEWGDEYPSLRFVEGTSSIGRQVEPYMEKIPYGKIEEWLAVANARFIPAARNHLLDLAELVLNMNCQAAHGPHLRKMIKIAQAKALAFVKGAGMSVKEITDKKVRGQ